MNAFLVTYTKLNGDDAGYGYKELFGKYSITNKNFFILSSQVRNKRMASFSNSSRFMYNSEKELKERLPEFENFINDFNRYETDYEVSYEIVELDINNFKDYNFEATDRFAENEELYGKRGMV